MDQCTSNKSKAGRLNWAAIFMGCLLAGMTGFWSTSVYGWEFDQSVCPSPEVGYEVEELPVPQAMIMLDKSASMLNTISSPCTEYECAYNGSWERNGCYMDVTIREDDPDVCVWPFGCSSNDDYFDFQEVVECPDCTTDQDCRDNVRNFFGEWIREHGDSWPSGDGEWEGVSEWRTADHRVLTEDYSGHTIDCRSCRTESECADAFRDWKEIEDTNDYMSIPTGTYREVSCSGTTSDSKWNIASDALNTVITDLTASDPDVIEFGLGLFETSGQATIKTEAKPNNRDAIVAELYDGNDADGWSTSLSDGIITMHNSNTIQNTSGGVGAGILVTDGMHNSGLSKQGVVEAACDHAEDGPLYVVGFGSGSDEKFNNVLAAAGGTGHNCDAAELCQHPNRWNWDRFEENCRGAKLAESPAALQVALSEIAGEISCSYPIETLSNGSSPFDWDESRQGCADDDYNCLRIRVGNLRVHHISAPDDDDHNPGWEFTNSQHDTIRLLNTGDGASGDYCDLLRNGLVDVPGDNNDVRVQRACMCVENTGNSCGASQMAPPPQTCECPQGEWVCNLGIDGCLPRSPCVNDGGNPIPATGTGGSCTVGIGECQRTGSWYCPEEGGGRACSVEPGEPEPEVCDNLDNDCGGVADELDSADDDTPGGLVRYGDRCHVDFIPNPGAAEQAAMDTETTRCNIGFRGCVDGAYTCEPLDPMPEVCNGIDDDCDNAGRIDNLNNSWNRSEFSAYSLSGETAPAACYERNVCSCPNGTDEIEGTDFSSYIDGWTNGTSPASPTCQCGEGIIE